MSGYYDPEMQERSAPGTCNRVVCYVWKTVTFLVSHITLIALVISYCLIGAKIFESLECEYELKIKADIAKIRNNVTDHLWNLSLHGVVMFEQENYTNLTIDYLKDFEAAILKAMTKDGWDGNENPEEPRWTFEGALFYSIIVITTIGYGHIAPKTDWGKVATIFYAILGIPLMLLCLSNVGDILATSFRFLYWKVCCYVCTKRPRRHRRSRSRTIRNSGGRQTRSRTASFKRSMRTSTRSADSGFGLSEIVPSSYSDTDLSRYQETEYSRVNSRGLSMPRMKLSRYPERRSQMGRQAIPHQQAAQQRGGSLDRRKPPKSLDLSLEPIILANTSVLCNRYVIPPPRDNTVNDNPNGDPSGSNHRHLHQRNNSSRQQIRPNYERSTSSPMQTRRATSMPRSQQQFLEPTRESSPEASVNSAKTGRKPKRSPLPSSPRIMSPMGFGHRQHYLDEADSETDYYDDEFSDMTMIRTKPVPIWLCVLLVLSYIIAGMFLFHHWENWDYLDAAYFCFITLTTIGFGDFVPEKRTLPKDSKLSIALCSLYLLFGIALLAMSFNLVQEEVLAKVRRVAKTLGIIKEEDGEEEEEDDAE